MSARKSQPTHRLGVIKRSLLDVEMPRLVRLLDEELDRYDEVAIAKRVSWIANKAEGLLPKDHEVVITTIKEHLETMCKDETLKSRLLTYLDGRKAA